MYSGNEPNVIVYLDFNDVRGDGLLPALRSEAKGIGSISKGVWALARDGEGNQCLARIERVRGELLYLSPNWDTWRTVPIALVSEAHFWQPFGSSADWGETEPAQGVDA